MATTQQKPVGFLDNLLFGFGRLSLTALKYMLLAFLSAFVFQFLTVIVGIGYASWSWWGIKLLILLATSVATGIAFFNVPKHRFWQASPITGLMILVLIFSLFFGDAGKHFAVTLSLLIGSIGFGIFMGFVVMITGGYGLAVAPTSDETVRTAEVRVKTVLFMALELLLFLWTIAYYVFTIGPGITPELGIFTLLSAFIALACAYTLNRGGAYAKVAILIATVLGFTVATTFNVLKAAAYYGLIESRTNNQWVETVQSFLFGLTDIAGSLQAWYWIISLTLLIAVAAAIQTGKWKNVRLAAVIVLPIFALLVINWWIWVADTGTRMGVWYGIQHAADYRAGGYINLYAWVIGLAISFAVAYVLRASPSTSTTASFLSRSALGTALVFFAVWLIAMGGIGVFTSALSGLPSVPRLPSLERPQVLYGFAARSLNDQLLIGGFIAFVLFSVLGMLTRAGGLVKFGIYAMLATWVIAILRSVVKFV